MKKFKDVPLLDITKEIILGSLLGDGSLKIHKSYKNARFSFRHSIRQKQYFFWKVRKLKEISHEKCTWLQKNDRGYSKLNKLRYQSCALESLTRIYEVTHKSGRFSIRREWLNDLSALSLAVWWMDDGSIISNGRKGVLCTDGFNEKSVKALARYLQKVWGVKAHMAPISRGAKVKKFYFRLWFRSTRELKKFFEIILPFIEVESMLRKVLILYKDNQLQQRWISKVVNKTGFSAQVVKKQLLLKKKRWKAY